MNTKNANTYVISKYDSYKAEVIRETITGCLLSLDIGNGEYAPAFAYGNFAVHDTLYVTVIRTFEDSSNRHSLVCVDSVLAYASEAVA